MRIVIVGAGIAGLTAGIALRRVGHEIFIVERAPELRAGGGALMLWGNAVQVLRELGVLEGMRDAAAPVDRVQFCNWRGEPLGSLPVGRVSRRHGAPTLVVPRRALLEAFIRAVPREALRLGAGCVDLVQYAHEATLRLEDGSVLRADLVVGADGLGSAVRRLLRGNEPTRAAGYEAWAGIARLRHRRVQPGVAVAVLGTGLRFWWAPLPGGDVYWYATVPLEDGEPSIDSPSELLDVFADWLLPVPDLIEATPETALLRAHIRDRAPISRWSCGRVTLVGDAVHPATPDLGQGACQAIVSAAVLAACLGEDRDVPDALAEYERRRIPRTARVNHLCRVTAMSSMLGDPWLCALRDAAMRLGFGAVALPELEWLLAPG